MDKLEHKFIKEELVSILENALNRTLGDIDIKGDFERTKANPKITGIAGDIVEHSLLGYPSDTRQEPDIVVDGKQVEVKTTGMRISKTDKFYEAKEPMSITAVSPKHIVYESFDDSNFWHKLKDLLIIYYHYSSDKTVSASEYADFYLRGYQFHEFSDEDKLRLMSDWQIVHDFIAELQKDYDNPEDEYYRISSELRPKLVCIDTAPKWPNPPRFRLKRTFVTKIIREHFKDKLIQEPCIVDELKLTKKDIKDLTTNFENLPDDYSSYEDVDNKCKILTKENYGLSIFQLLDKYNIEYDKTRPLPKAICEQIVIRMFGGNSKKINRIAMFNDFNLIAKTIVLSKNNHRTEDMKLFYLDFDEWCFENDDFEKSYVYDYFMNYQLICIKFKEISDKTQKEDFGNNIFIGFDRIAFDDNFINNDVRNIWLRIRDLVINKKLKESVVINKTTGLPVINKNGVISTALNFPKSKEGTIFVRGSGIDSLNKPKTINGIKMYHQYIWIKGKYIEERLNNKGKNETC